MFNHSGLPTIKIDDILMGETITNIRKTVDPDDIKNLAESIYSTGLMHPPILAEVEDDNGQVAYEVVSGFCRLNAIKYIIENIDDSFEDTVAFIPFEGELEDAIFSNAMENLDRTDLNPVDLAEWVYERVSGDDPMPRKDLADKLGKSEPWISMRVTFVEKACKLLIEAVRSGDISFSAAYELSKKDEATQMKFLKEQRTRWDKLTAEDAKNAGSKETSKRPTKKHIETRLKIVEDALENYGGNAENCTLLGYQQSMRWVVGLLTTEEFDEALGIAQED